MSSNAAASARIQKRHSDRHGQGRHTFITRAQRLERSDESVPLLLLGIQFPPCSLDTRTRGVYGNCRESQMKCQKQAGWVTFDVMSLSANFIFVRVENFLMRKVKD
jgi:hypothetical protein